MPHHSTRVAKFRFLSTLAIVSLMVSTGFLGTAQSQIPHHSVLNHKVLISASGVSDEDTVVTDGDTIEFCPASAGLEFSIVFNTSPFAPAGHGKLNFDDRSCGHPLQATLKPGDHARAFDYVLAVGNLYFDPHVIIMPGGKPGPK